MRAAIFETFQQPLTIQNVPDPAPDARGAVLRVEATGLCRSDWHAWMGHDTDVQLPHVPGHEMAGVVEAVGKDVTRWRRGDRVTLPFVGSCGACPQCLSGNHQVCDHQRQPGFSYWGSFAQYVAIEQADVNLVRLPDEMDFVTAASLGCRFITSFRAIVQQGRVSAGQWVAVHGCGGVGLSAIMIASAVGASVVAIDVADDKLAFAQSVGATATVNARKVSDVVAQVREITQGGAHVSVDALGSLATCFNSVANLRKRGKHIQVGLMLGGQQHPAVPMNQVIAKELEILGSHGMQPYHYAPMFEMIRRGTLRPDKLIGQTLSLAEAAVALPLMDTFSGVGVKVINAF